jgi:hypothetical protein
MSARKRPGRSQEQSIMIVEFIAAASCQVGALACAAAGVWIAAAVLSFLGFLYAVALGRQLLATRSADQMYEVAETIKERLLDLAVQRDQKFRDELDRLERGDL